MKNILERQVLDHLSVLRKIQHRQTISAEKLKDFSGQILVESKRGNGAVYYYGKSPGERKRYYLGKDDSEEVMRIKEAHYLEESLAAVNNNIKLLEQVVHGYRGFDYDSIDERLPKVYRSARINTAGNLDARALEWKRNKEQFIREYNLQHPDRHPESLIVQRANGQMVRSRAEAAIADLLDANDLAWVYELPHKCGDIWIRTDFTILSPLDLRSEFLLEHAGLLSMQSYQKQFLDKLVAYMNAGYRPNENLFFSFENADKSFSQVPVQKIIDSWIKA